MLAEPQAHLLSYDYVAAFFDVIVINFFFLVQALKSRTPSISQAPNWILAKLVRKKETIQKA